MKNVYEIRKLGRDYCNQTEGSAHYQEGGVGAEPIDLMMAMGKDTAEGFFLGNIIKYAKRFKKTRNLKDMMKISDYAHLMCGLEIETTAKESNKE
jgi:hypothetical protein